MKDLNWKKLYLHQKKLIEKSYYSYYSQNSINYLSYINIPTK